MFLFVFQLSASNSVRAEAIEEDEESRYKITDVIGKHSLVFFKLSYKTVKK